MPRPFYLILILAISFTAPISAQPRIDPAGIQGTLLLCGNEQPSAAALEKFVELAGGAKAKLVIVSADKAKADSPLRKRIAETAKKHKATVPVVVNHEDASAALRGATGVWLHVDSSIQSRKKKSLADDCRDVLKRGGVIAAAGYGATIVGSAQRADDHGKLVLALLPDSIIELGRKPGSLEKVQIRPQPKGVVIFGIQHDAAMLVQGRTISAIGVAGQGALSIAAGTRGSLYAGAIKQDLTALRRAVRARAEGFPPKMPGTPLLEKGTLVIVGGGGAPAGLTKKFVEYAGGAGKACIVIFPTAQPDPLPKREAQAAAFRKAGAKKATVLYGRTRSEVESKDFLDTLKEATGLWFDGGRQWRFVDCYENTKALPLMFDVLKRGGVIGGSSAGATIQGDYLCRGGVFNNFDIRYEGYERGFGFLKGVAIDQHFTQRKRQSDMTKLMKIYPQYLGIGIDEATAIVVQGSNAEVIGKGKVHFYDTNRQAEKGQPDFLALPAGGRYDLQARKVLPEKP